MSHVTGNILQIQADIKSQSLAAGRDVGSTRLLAVSKTFGPDAVLEAYEAGQTEFGENYLQESLEKIEALKQLPLQWHFIGPIQSNKTKPIAEHFDWVQTVERDKIIHRLNDQRPEHLPPLNVLLQVNISADIDKAGLCAGHTHVSEQLLALPIAEHPLYKLVEQKALLINNCPRLLLRGLMTISAAGLSEQELSLQYGLLDQIYRQLQQNFSQIDTLSMGMSGDFITAINNGSTMVRIGTGIFGRRDK